MFEENNPKIALNTLYIKEKEINPTYISKHNSTREKQVIILMIPKEEKEGWHYLAVKKLSALLHGITWNIVYIVFILLEQKINLPLMKK